MARTGFNSLFQGSEGFIYANIGPIAFWGICCAAFAVVVTAIIWIINHCINVFAYGDEAALHDERPFDGFQIRSWQNVLKTPILAAILVAVFYGIVNILWAIAVVDFRIWTFDIRTFSFVRIVSFMKYVPLFFIFYMVSAAFSQNYRVKDLPEWATIAINVFFNVIGIMLLFWIQNSHFINTGAMIDSANKSFFIACYPHHSLRSGCYRRCKKNVRTHRQRLAGRSCERNDNDLYRLREHLHFRHRRLVLRSITVTDKKADAFGRLFFSPCRTSPVGRAARLAGGVTGAPCRRGDRRICHA